MNAITAPGEVAAAIRARRETLDISQLEHAVAADRSLSMISTFERGYVGKRSHVLPRILKTLEDMEHAA